MRGGKRMSVEFSGEFLKKKSDIGDGCPSKYTPSNVYETCEKLLKTT